MSDAEGIRLQKVLSQAGIASRRVAERMITDGRVEVDGRVVTELGTRVDPGNAEIRVDGARVMLDDSLVYLAINKPTGMHSTMSDDRGRPCVGDLVEHRVRGNRNLFHVGRLDADTEGLLLLTNDGELAHRLMHPSFEVPKTYLATVAGTVPRGLGKTLRAGVELDDGPAAVDDFAVVDAVPARQWCASPCTRGANASCADCWPRSVSRSRRWYAPTSDRWRWATSGPAVFAR